VSRLEVKILSYGTLSRSPAAASDFRDEVGHHRYHGSSATNGGERLAESRGGPRPDAAKTIL
jgi:hypothetical protein